jgi:hypothetical protein
MKPVTALATIGAIGGVAYGAIQRKSFWTTVGFTLLFSISGAAIGGFVNALTTNLPTEQQ